VNEEKNEIVDERKFVKRLKESNVFRNSEIDKIQKDDILYRKSYLLGVVDSFLYYDK